MASYTLVSGHIVEHEPTPEVEKFLTTIRGMVEDPEVSINAVVAFAYSAENPLLDEYPYGGRGAITAKTLANPSYKVLTDLVFRKQHTPEQIQALADKHTMTVPQVAEKLGVHESAVRQSIAVGRLASWVKNGRHYLDPAAVEKYETTARGPKPQVPRKSGSKLEVYMGAGNGVAFRVKPDCEWESTAKHGHGTRAVASDWSRVAVFSAEKGDARFVVLEPSEVENEYSLAEFYVKGKFRITEKENNSKAAEKRWKEWNTASR